MSVHWWISSCAGKRNIRKLLVRAPRLAKGAAFLLGMFLLLSPGASAQRTQLKPGWNMFSPQQDVELGKKAALDAARQLPSCNADRKSVV